MGRYLYYIIALVTAGLMFLTYFLVHKKANKRIHLVHVIVAWGVFALFFVWSLLSKGGYLRNVVRVELFSPFEGVKTVVSTADATRMALFGYWMFIVLHITTIVSAMFKFKVIHRMEHIISPVLALFCLIFLPYFIFGEVKTFEVTACGILIAVELGVIVGKLIYQAIFEQISYKMDKYEIVELVMCTLGAVLFTMPEFLPYSLFGNVTFYAPMKSFATGHRYYLYMTFIFLIGLPILLRHRRGEYARMIMFYISMGGLIAFANGYSFADIIHPWDWPLHICNTAMFILPIALVTKSEKVFYFTFFINILGAFLAIMMPEYADDTNFIAPRAVEFFTNHILAFAGPLVCVLAGVFPRPKKKQFFYSMVGFAIYYLVVLFANTFFTAFVPRYDAQGNLDRYNFFYINDDFVAKKIGASDLLYKFAWNFDIADKHFTMYPLYQVIYFFGFVLMSIGMWYVYAWIFQFQDTLIYLNNRAAAMKMDQLALTQKFNQKEVSSCMNPESVDKLVISHFGKRYSESAPFAVRDINFVANAGEIIGFLGPNGAGKSTTIKAIVGIHLPTEGKIEVNGFDVAVQPVQAKRQIGFVPDHYALYENLSGREYLNYIADLYEVSQKDRDEFLEEFLDTLAMREAIDNKMQTYSHGMKQKIAIMASIIHNPKLWILDEPLTGLDPVSIFQVKQCLKRHAEKGNIVFFSSHLIDIVEKLCDRIIIISHHKVVAVDNVKELTDKGVNLEQYYMEKTGQETGN